MMTSDNTTAFLLAAALIGLISVVIGVVIGFILAGLRSSPSVTSGQRRPNEIARLLKNSRSGQLDVEINGKVFSTSNGLNTVQRKMLVQAYDELRLWLGFEDLAERLPTAPQPAPRAEPAAKPGITTPPVAPPSLASKSPNPQRPLRPEPVSTVKPPSMDMRDILAGVFTAGDTSRETPDEPTTLAGQIDAIIQERLPQSPLQDRTIKLKDSLDGGIVVIVDGQRYNGVGEVTDSQVREFIQRCVTEWEKKYGK